MPPASERLGAASPASREGEVDPEEPVIGPDPVDAPEPFPALEPLGPPGAPEPLEGMEAPDGIVPAKDPDVALEAPAPLLFWSGAEGPGEPAPHAARAGASTRGRAHRSRMEKT